MRRTPAGIAMALTALLLLSIVGTAAVQVKPQTLLNDTDWPAMSTGARSTSPEVFLAGGGSGSHDEFSGAITATDNGWVIAGDVNSSAAASRGGTNLIFGTQTYVPTSPYSNGNDFFIASMDS